MGWYARRVLPRALDWVMSNPVMTAHRRALLSRAKGEVLEIGFGTGLNLPHYPPDITRITVVDPNPGMHRLAQKRIAESGRTVIPIVVGGERLALADQSFDTVVSTWTLCSIGPVEAALREIRRVLRPEGRLLFIEHGLSPEASVAKWQHRLTPLQKRLGDGCHLNRDIAALIRDSGLNIGELTRFDLEATPRVFGHTYRGLASP